MPEIQIGYKPMCNYQLLILNSILLLRGFVLRLYSLVYQLFTPPPAVSTTILAYPNMGKLLFQYSLISQFV
jgi:hypothetical protein